MLRLTFAFGTAPSKWVHRYNEYTTHEELVAQASPDPLSQLQAGLADIALVRLPDPRLADPSALQASPEASAQLADATSTAALNQDAATQEAANQDAANLGTQNQDSVSHTANGASSSEVEKLAPLNPADYHQVFLYDEALGVAFPQDHPAKLFNALSPEDISEEILHATPAQGQAWEVASLDGNLQVVAANVGMQVGPLPLLRAVANKQVVVRELHDPAYATANDPGDPNQRQVAYSASRIVLVWAKESDSPEIQDFVGICKGRRAGSSRQVAGPKAKDQKAKGSKSKGQQSKTQKNKQSAKGAKSAARGSAKQKNSGVSSQRSRSGKSKSKPQLRGNSQRKRRR